MRQDRRHAGQGGGQPGRDGGKNGPQGSRQPVSRIFGTVSGLAPRAVDVAAGANVLMLVLRSASLLCRACSGRARRAASGRTLAIPFRGGKPRGFPPASADIKYTFMQADLSKISSAERLARAVLLFFSCGPWTAEKAAEWEATTGRAEATSKVLGDLARRVQTECERKQAVVGVELPRVWADGGDETGTGRGIGHPSRR
jgi:hypothetical protein